MIEASAGSRHGPVATVGDPDPDPGADVAHEPVELVPGMTFREAKAHAVARFERGYVRALLAAHDGNLSRAARSVRMDRNHLRDLAKRHAVPVRG